MAIDWSNIGNSAITGGINSAVNGLLGGLQARQNWKYTQKSLALQQRYAKEAFDWQVDRDNWLLKNQALLTKEGLKKAGYSVADPSGIGAQLTGMSSPSADPANGDFSPFRMPPFDMMASYTQLKQGELMDAQKELIQSQAHGQDIENRLRSLYGDAEYQSTIGKMQEETRKYVSERLYTDQKKLNDTSLTEAQVNNINQRLQMDWTQLPLQLRLLSAQIELTGSERDKNFGQIKEIAQHIQNMKAEYNLTNAQVDVAFALAGKYDAEAANTRVQSHVTKAYVYKAESEARQEKIRADVMESLGVNYYVGDQIVTTIGKATQSIGNILSSLVH